VIGPGNPGQDATGSARGGPVLPKRLEVPRPGKVGMTC